MTWKRFLEDVGFAGAITAVVAFMLYLPPAVSTSQAEVVQEVLFIEADSVRSQRGIHGFELSKTPDNRLHVSVISQHRGADIYFDPSPAAGLSTVTVNVGGSGETLIIAMAEDYGGTISINGNQVTSWEHDDGEWIFAETDQLRGFTSWNILSDTLEDEGMEDVITNSMVAFWGGIGIIITIVVLVVTIITAYSILKIGLAAKKANCAKALRDCQNANPPYDPTDGQCIYWHAECKQMPIYGTWCCILDGKCEDGDGESCNLAADHCPIEEYPPCHPLWVD